MVLLAPIGATDGRMIAASVMGYPIVRVSMILTVVGIGRIVILAVVGIG